MAKTYYDEEADEIVVPGQGFDLTILSAGAQKQIMRANETEMTDAVISAAKANSRSKAAMVALVSQAQLEEVVSTLMRRNPRMGAIENLAKLADANAEYLSRLILDEKKRR